LAFNSETAPLYSDTQDKSEGKSQKPELQGSVNQDVAINHLPATTKIQASLPEGFVGQGNSRVIAQVSQPVTKKGEILIPSGSQLIGGIQAILPGRVEISFTSLILPNGSEKKMEDALAFQGNTSGVLAQVSDPRINADSGGLTGNVLTALGDELVRSTSSFSSAGLGGSISSVNSGPTGERILGAAVKGVGKTIQDSTQGNAQAVKNQQPSVSIPPKSEITIVLFKGMDL
jgi:Bacterial conjugation TrbI-like protein